ncbi:MAG: DUF11 domain-containing protein, partial [Chloroflexi bacterium]|nr:DUF11 domain-containing protein [Chloroflexota bacterium]
MGDQHDGQASEARGYTAVPSTLWGTTYYSPVNGSVGNGTDLYLYNPNNAQISINWEDSSGSGSFNIPALSSIAYSDALGANHEIPSNSAAKVSSSSTFWGIASVDYEDLNYDWNFSLIPSNKLTTEYFLGWAPGTSDPSPAANCSPVWVTAIADNTVISVDYSPIDGTYDLVTTIDELDSYQIFDPDNDNTGMHIVSSSPIAVAWGEWDGGGCGVGNPNMDLGYTVLPLLEEFIDVVLDITKTANPALVENAVGQTTTFTIVGETKAFAVSDAYIEDQLPANWAYVPGSTSATWSGGAFTPASLATADPTITGGGSILTWNFQQDMAANQTITVVFDAITTGQPGLSSINLGEIYGEFDPNTGDAEPGVMISATDTAVVLSQNPDLTAVKSNDESGEIDNTETFNWSIVVANDGGSAGTAFFEDGATILTDDLPTGPTYGTPGIVNGGTVPTGTGTIDCSITTDTLTCSATGGTVELAPGASFTVSFLVTPVGAGTLENPDTGGICTVDPDDVNGEDDETNNDCSDTVVVTGPPPEITKSSDSGGDDDGIVEPGDTITYTINIENTSGEVQTDVVISDLLPTGTSYVPNSTVVTAWEYSGTDTYLDQFTDDTIYTNSQGTLNWPTSWVESGDTGGINPQLTGTISIQSNELHFQNIDGDSISRNIDLSGETSVTLTFDYTRTSSTSVDPVDVDLWDANLSEWVEVGSTTAASGTITHILTTDEISASSAIRFRGNDTSWQTSDIVNIDNVQFEVLGSTPSAVTKDNVVAGANPDLVDGAPSDLVVTGDNLIIPIGNTMTVTYQVLFDDIQNAQTQVVNTAAFTSTQQLDPIDDTATDDILAIDISLDKQIDDSAPEVGDTVLFTLVIANAGPATATDIDVTDVVPSGYTYVTDSILGGDANDQSSPTGTGLTWTIDSLDSGFDTSLTYEAVVLASGTYDNYAEVTDHTEGDVDSTPGNGQQDPDEDDDDTLTITPPSITVDKVSNSGDDIVDPGETVTYTITITNIGDFRQNNIVVSDPLPTGSAYVANSTVVVGYESSGSNGTYLDQFTNPGYSNSQGTLPWSTSWVETDPDDEISNTTPGALEFIAADSSNLDGTIQRSIDLSGAATAVLSLDWNRVVDIGQEESLDIQLWDGSTWVTVDSTDTGVATTGTETHSLVANQISASSAIRIINGSGVWSDTERIDIDNVTFTVTGASYDPVTKDNIPAGVNADLADGVPSDLVEAGDGFVLDPGDSMTVTFQVLVDDPTAETELYNEVTVTSVEQTEALTDDVTDNISEPKGSITIIKITDPTDPQDFAFTATGTGVSGFTLDDDGNNANTYSNTELFSDLEDGSFQINEVAVSAYIITNISCEGDTNSTITIGDADGFDDGDVGVGITLSDAEDITCTFTNTEEAALTIVKKVVNDNGGTAVVGDFTITTDAGSLVFGTAVESP